MFSSPEFWGTIGAAVVSAVVSGVIAGAKGAASAVKSCMDNYQMQIQNLSMAVEHLKKEKIEKLEITISDHVSKDQTQRVITSMEHLTGAVTKMDTRMDGKFDNVVKEIGNISSKVQGQDEKIEAVKDYVHNLDNSFQNHKNIHHRS